MADVFITAVSASYTGTENADNFRNSTGNLRAITVNGLGGNDILNLGSAVNLGTGAGGIGLGYSLGSSTISMGAGDDTYSFSGQAGSGFAFQASTITDMGDGSDFLLMNGLASASAATVKGGSGSDQMTFLSQTTAGNSAFDVWINGNAGADSLTVSWTGTRASYFRVEGGADNDTISATFSAIAAYTAAASGSNQSGARVQGNKGDDILFVTANATAAELTVNGNSGNDTVAVSFLADNSGSNVFGGRGDDVISAVLDAGVSAERLTINGNLGADTATLNVNGNLLSAVTLDGGSGADVLTLSANGVSTLGGVSVVGGTGTDTININIDGNTTITAASGFVVNGSEGSGDSISINASATLGGSANALIIGNSGADTITLNSNTGGAISGATISANGGADLIGLVGRTNGTFAGVDAFGGSGADTLTATFVAGGFAASGDGNLLDGGSGADSINVSISTAALVTALSVVGGLGADALILNIASGGWAVSNGQTAGRVFSFDGGEGADTIGLIGGTGAHIGLDVVAGAGNDLITGTFATGAHFDPLTDVIGGDGADTISFLFTAAATAGAITLGGSALVVGGSGTDSISIVANALSGGTFNFGSIRGGTGVDTITFGGQLGGTADIGVYSGSINAGAGTDSIIFSGNNVVSGGVGRFRGNGLAGAGAAAAGANAFIVASGDSDVQGFDTIFVSNNDVTGGLANLAGTFGTAGLVFSGYNSDVAGTFTMRVASGGVANAVAATGGLTLGQAIFTAAGIAGAPGIGVTTGGLIAGVSAGGTRAASNGAFVLTGGSTLGQIFSAVDAVTIGRGTVSVFNVQNGSAGSVDGYVFVQGGVLNDTIIKFAGNGVAAGSFGAGEGYFSAGNANALVRGRTQQFGTSGGQVFFGANVGVG